MARARSISSSWLVGTLALLVLAAPGCRRRPSPAFNEASTLFSSLTNQMGDDAYGDPRMDEVDRLLATVPADSLDAAAAEALRQRIAAGRAAYQKAQHPESTPGAEGTREDPWANWKPPPPPPPAAPDAGMAHPDVGMTVDELKARFSDCFQFKQQVDLEGRGRRDVWSLVDSDACRKAHPDQKRWLLVLDEEGKRVMGAAPQTALRYSDRYVYPDGGEAPPPAQKP